MNVLFVGPCAFGTSKTRFLGFQDTHNVSAIDTDLIFGNYLSRSTFDRIKLRFLRDIFSEKLIKEAQAKDCSQMDVVWIDSPYAATPRFLRAIKSKNTKIVIYLTDSIKSPGLTSVFKNINPRMIDLIITSKDKELSDFLSQGYTCIYDQQRISKSQCHSVNFENKPTELMYAADFTKPKLNQIRSLIPVDKSCFVYGRNWPKEPGLIIKGWLHGDDYFTQINSTKVALGIQNLEMNDTLTTRIFEIPSAGSLLAANRFPEIEHVFGDSIIYFDECPGRIAEVLRDDELCEMMTRKSQDRCLAHVSLVETMLDDLL